MCGSGLNQDLLSKYLIKGKIYFIEYESLHIIYFRCGKAILVTKNTSLRFDILGDGLDDGGDFSIDDVKLI